MDEVIIHILHTSLIKGNYAFILSFVDEKRRVKAERYVHEKDRLLSLGAGYLLKKYLSNGEIKENSSGKPFLLNGPLFNLSHSGEYVVLAIHPSRDVGVDIERIDENKIDAIKFVLNEEEKDVTDLNTLFRIWSNKESLIKCNAQGLKDIKHVCGLPLEGSKTYDDEDYFCKSMIYENYSLSITLKEKEPFNLFINRINCLEE